MNVRSVFVTGGTGYLGRQLIPALLQRGHTVKALVRKGSEQKLPPKSTGVIGDALNQMTFTRNVAPADTFVHLIGVARPSPSKAKEFRSIDLASVRESVAAAKSAGIHHFVYVSVAQPAPIMKTYLEFRREAEEMIMSMNINATILRPLYVIGPGHRWPLVLVPLYWLFERIPSTSESAQRLGLVTLSQMITALVYAVEHPSKGITIVDVPRIRATIYEAEDR
jgi:uncharacterized protein YbjT (DUF2867 family)